MNTCEIIMILIVYFFQSSYEILTETTENIQTTTIKPFVFRLNSTVIENGPPQIKTRGIERLEIYHLWVYCNGTQTVNGRKFLSNDFVEFKYNKTFYHYFHPICALNETDVCVVEIETDVRYQGETYFENQKFLMTDGNKISIGRGRKYFICEYKQNKVYTFYTREQCLDDLETNEEEYANMTKFEKADVDRRQVKMTNDYLRNKREEIEQYRKTLTRSTTTLPLNFTWPLETKTNETSNWNGVAVYGGVMIVVVGLLVWGAIKTKKHPNSIVFKSLRQNNSERIESFQIVNL